MNILCCALGAAMEGRMHPSGVYLPDAVIANSGLSYIRFRLAPHLARIHDFIHTLVSKLKPPHEKRISISVRAGGAPNGEKAETG